jgi:hypothetical protein
MFNVQPLNKIITLSTVTLSPIVPQPLGERDKEALMTRHPKSPIVKEVDRQFRHLAGRHGTSCYNPVTGGGFVFGMRGEDSIAAQKRSACRALVAREWHAHNSPSAPPLLVNCYEIEEARWKGGFSQLFAFFCQSVATANWAIAGHPPFEIYARGALASPRCPQTLKNDKALARRFPPQPIYSLGHGLTWHLNGRRGTTLIYHP